MQQSGGRRIKRSLFIDASAVRFLTEAEEDHLEEIHLLSSYIGQKQEEIRAWNQAQSGASAERLANRRRLTNLGTYRAFAEAYIKQHPNVRANMTCMVRQLQSTSEGVPLEVYCFTRTVVWAEYERIQGDIFDYLLAVLPEFGLSLYQQPSGRDMRAGLGSQHIEATPQRRTVADAANQ